MYLYLQNTIRFVSENTENVFFVLLSDESSSDLTNSFLLHF